MRKRIWNFNNLKKTYYYLKKNGFKNAYYAALERIEDKSASEYAYAPPEHSELERQAAASQDNSCLFSILVPAYETKEEYLTKMIESVLAQTYTGLELIIADASKSDAVFCVTERYKDKRIRYRRLADNKGIAENTNAALEIAEGDYISLLDHDDLLTPDALFTVAENIKAREKKGCEVWMLYSDEDKTNGDETEYYEPNLKPDLNVDLLLSNNYICHFLVMKKELMKHLGLRPGYDGAQDYDLILRAAGAIIYGDKEQDKVKKPWQGAGRESVIHIQKVLYHWRCHAGSTAENPESKQYAYEAGRRAAEDFLQERGWKGQVVHTCHLGFYRICYESELFSYRPSAGVIGGKVIDRRGRMSGGVFDHTGKPIYDGLRKEFSGYMHRAVLAQEVFAVDVRCMKVRPELWELFKQVFAVSYEEDVQTGMFDRRKLKSQNGLEEKSLVFCQKAAKLGYEILWMPDRIVKIK